MMGVSTNASVWSAASVFVFADIIFADIIFLTVILTS